MNWTPEDHHDYSSQHQQKADKYRLVQSALCDADMMPVFSRRPVDPVQPQAA